MKIQEVLSSYGHWETHNMSGKSCLCLNTRAPGAFSDKVTPGIDYFTSSSVWYKW